MRNPKDLELWEISWLKREKGGVDEWSNEDEEEDEEEGGDWGQDIFQSELSWSVSWSFQSESSYSACFDSRSWTKSVQIDSSKAMCAQLLKLPAGSTFEIIFPMSLIKECLTVIFGLPKGFT